MSKTISDEKSAAPKPTNREWLMMREALRRDDRCLSPMSSLRGTRVGKTGEKLTCRGDREGHAQPNTAPDRAVRVRR